MLVVVILNINNRLSLVNAEFLFNFSFIACSVGKFNSKNDIVTVVFNSNVSAHLRYKVIIFLIKRPTANTRTAN